MSLEATGIQENILNKPELSIVIPCLNEVETIAICIRKGRRFLEENEIKGEIIVADNGSEDGSLEIILKEAVTLVNISEQGYGNALKGGIAAAKGDFVIMGDADDSYDFSDLMPLLEKLRAGNALVMGNRFKGGIENDAMPFLHRYLGNPVLSFLGRLFFKSPVGDFHCGLRGFTKEAFEKMDLQTSGMEFASEMVVKASLHEMKIAEVPVKLFKDGRTRPAHLQTWRDGWRHLRFLLMYSPRWLFLFPGILMIIVGGGFSAALISAPLEIGNIRLDVHTLLYSSMAVLIGFQFVFFYLFTKVFAVKNKLLPKNDKLERFLKYFYLERGIFTGALFVLFGLGLTIWSLQLWSSVGFGDLEPSRILRYVIPAATLITLGVQIVLYSFFLSILGLSSGKHG